MNVFPAVLTIEDRIIRITNALEMLSLAGRGLDDAHGEAIASMANAARAELDAIDAALDDRVQIRLAPEAALSRALDAARAVGDPVAIAKAALRASGLDCGIVT